MTAAVYLLLATICIIGVGVFSETGTDRISAETEESKELSEHDDVDERCGIVDLEVVLMHGHCFDEWLHPAQDCPLLNHSWRSCSRGPPVA